MPKNTILPIKHAEWIRVHLHDFPRFKKLFHEKSVYDFYVNNKKVIKKDILFLVRAMRINEFCDILDDNGIWWKLER